MPLSRIASRSDPSSTESLKLMRVARAVLDDVVGSLLGDAVDDPFEVFGDGDFSGNFFKLL
jgi:hypothetical protein